MITAAVSPRSLADWLAVCGWARQDSRWSRETASGRAYARRGPATSGWEAWELEGGALPRPGTRGLLAANARLPGPCKLVRRDDGSIGCRADVPIELLGDHVEWSSTAAEAEHPLESWARSITAVVAGFAPTGDAADARAAAADELVDWLQTAGWPAAAGDGAVRVTVQLPGAYRQIELPIGEPGRTRLGVELVNWSGWPPACRRAATELALEANDRLHLVRFAVPEESQGERLIAEVHLASAWVPGAWLAMALEAIRTAIALTARELAALRDPELALLTLAAHAA